MFRLKKTDRHLVRQVLGGDRDGYEALVERHYPTALSIALTYTGNPSDAEDVVQDAFVKAYTSLDQLKEPEKFMGWLSAIVRNGARRLYSKKKREQEVLQQHRPDSSEPAVDVSMREMMHLMRHRLDGLDDTHREVLTMYYFGGQNSTEIAQALDVNKEAVLKRLQRAREALGHEMMAAIKEPEKDEQNHSTQIAKISRAIIATGVAWEIAGFGGGAVAAATLVIAKAVVVLSGFTAAGVGVYSIAANYNPKSQPVEESDPKAVQEMNMSSVTVKAINEETEVPSGPMAKMVQNPFASSKIAEQMDLAKPESLSTADIWSDLDGTLWSARVLDGPDRSGAEDIESTEFQLDVWDVRNPESGDHTESGFVMMLSGKNKEKIPFGLFGQAGYPKVVFGVYTDMDGRRVVPSNHVLDMTGQFSENRRKIVISGSNTDNEFIKLEFKRQKDLTMKDLNRTKWQLKSVSINGDEEGREVEKARLEMTVRKGILTIRDLSGMPFGTHFEGSWHDKHVDLTLTISLEDPNEGKYSMSGKFDGDFDSKLNILELSGEITGLQEDQELSMAFRMERISENMNVELLTQQYKSEAQQLLSELVAYAKANDHSLPSRLAELSFRNPGDRRIIQNNKNQRITYSALEAGEVDLEPWHSAPVIPDSFQKMEGDSLPDKMMNYEKLLLDVRGPFPGYQIVARIEHSDVGVGFELDLRNQRVYQMTLPPVGIDEREQFRAKQRASCANNMKQLGLVLKMYENENPQELIAAGWASVYPEYLSDPRVLLCPGSPTEESSYEILYPASNGTYWKEIHAEVYGASSAYSGARVPWIIETRPCRAHSDGRHVVFVDGHAEFIKNAEWSTRMGPFLEHAYTIR